MRQQLVSVEARQQGQFFLDRVADFDALEVTGLATHFAEAESDPTFTREQGRRFRGAVQAAKAREHQARQRGAVVNGPEALL